MGRLAGRVAIITGGGRGIGRATAERFCEEGARVLIGTRSAEPGEATIRAITDAGGEAILEVFDVGDRESCRRLVARAVNHFGKIDILLHNAAFTDGGRLESTEDHYLDQTIDVGLKPCFWLSADALPHLEKSRSARILVTSSVTGNRWVTPGRSAYSAVKCGVNGFIRSAAIELANRGITVNGVEPGLTLTDTIDRLTTPELLSQMAASIPLGRAVHPREIAEAFVYLASDEAAMMTGQTLVIDGGATLGFAQPAAFDDH